MRCGTRVAVAVTLLVVAACSSDSRKPTPTSASESTAAAAVTSSAPAPPAATAFVPEPIAWSGCGRNLRCATVKVPLDYTNPTGPTIDIAVNELPARKPSQRIGALLVNPGGPGGSGLEFVAGGLDLPGTILDRFDVVGFDPRGVGASTKLPCGDSTVPAFRHVDSSPDTPEEQTALDDAAKAVADDCAQHAGNLIPFMGTDDAVRDIDMIRQALGEDQLNFLGISYGTLLGLRYAQLFPHGARAIAIDGVIDPTQDFATFLRLQTIAYDKEANVMFDGCPDGGAGCPPGGARAAYDELAARVEAAPIPGPNGESLGPSELVDAALIPTYEPTAYSRFYEGLTSALDGRAGPLLALTDAYQTSVDFPLYASVECIDSPHPEGADAFRAFAQELAGLSPRFGAAVANELLPCAYWSAPVRSIVGPVTAPEAPPMLVIGTTGDPATPYEQAVRVAQTLAHGRLLTFVADRHAAYGASTCAANAEAAYFVDLQLPAEGTTCTN